MADEDKHIALRELQSKYASTTGALKQLDSHKRQHAISLQRAAFTAAQLDALPDSTPTYRQLGKAYVLQPKPEVMASLEASVATTDGELKAMASRRETLVSAVAGLERDILELIK